MIFALILFANFGGIYGSSATTVHGFVSREACERAGADFVRSEQRVKYKCLQVRP